MGVTRGWLPQRAGSPIPVGSGDADAVPPVTRGLALVRVQTHADLEPSDLKQNGRPGLVMYYSPAKFGDNTSSGFCFRVLTHTYIHTHTYIQSG